MFWPFSMLKEHLLLEPWITSENWNVFQDFSLIKLSLGIRVSQWRILEAKQLRLRLQCRKYKVNYVRTWIQWCENMNSMACKRLDILITSRCPMSLPSLWFSQTYWKKSYKKKQYLFQKLKLLILKMSSCMPTAL